MWKVMWTGEKDRGVKGFHSTHDTNLRPFERAGFCPSGSLDHRSEKQIVDGSARRPT